jgi:hypothetical protein
VNSNFNSGNDQTLFTITTEYKDPENDPPVDVKVNFYYDQAGDRLAKSVSLNRLAVDDDPFSVGVTY